MYGRDLDKDIHAETSGQFREVMLAQSHGNRDTTEDVMVAIRDAEDLTMVTAYITGASREGMIVSRDGMSVSRDDMSVSRDDMSVSRDGMSVSRDGMTVSRDGMGCQVMV